MPHLETARRRLRSRNGPEVPDRILRAARAVFARRGYAATTTREIARRARVDRYAIYYHFEKKRGLYDAVIESFISRFADFSRSIMPARLVGRQELERLFADLLRFLASHREEMKIIQRETIDGNSEHVTRWVKEYLLPVFQAGVNFTEAGKAAGEFRIDLDPRQFIVSIWSLSLSYFADSALLAALLGEDPLSDDLIEKRSREISRYALEALGVSGP